MELTLWTYEGPPHVGAMRIATSMTGVHYVLHAPQGDTYADLLFTMIERRDKRPPVTYTTFQARDLGGEGDRSGQDGTRLDGLVDQARRLRRGTDEMRGLVALEEGRPDERQPDPRLLHDLGRGPAELHRL